MKPDAPLLGKNRVAAGIALSLAVHGALLFAFRYHTPLAKDDSGARREMLVVHLQPPPPPPAASPEPALEPKSEPKPAPKPRRAQPARPAPSAQKTEVIALPDDAPKAAPQERFTVAPVEEGPVFDPDAARKYARSIATKPDPARAGMAVAQIPEKPLETETKTARAIASAKRRNCKDGLPGGLLGPIIILFDKKDGGCKW